MVRWWFGGGFGKFAGLGSRWFISKNLPAIG